MAGSWSRERPANGQENAWIEDFGVGRDAAWLSMDDRRLSDCVATVST